jgi:hypothetical protein
MEHLELAHPHKERADLSNAQLEHVLPQTLTDEWRADLGLEAERIHVTWLNTPGNLTLSGYNPELQNRPFAVKRREYANSNIVLTRRLTELDRWDEAQIMKRGRQLGEMAATIWSGPDHDVPVTPTEAPSDNHQPSQSDSERHALRRRYWTAFGEILARNGSAIKPPSPEPSYWRPFSSPLVGVSVWATINLRRRRITVGVTMRGPRGQAVFDRLNRDREYLEKELGAPISWTAEPGRYERYIELEQRDTNPADEPAWPEQHAWLQGRLEALYHCLQTRT